MSISTIPASMNGQVPDVLQLILDSDDEFFCEQLPPSLKTDDFGPHISMLYHEKVLARVLALDDVWFLYFILTVAGPEYGDLEVLFHERILPRIASLPESLFLGKFLPQARRLPNFSDRDMQYKLRMWREQARASPPSAFPAPQSATDLLAKTLPPLRCFVEDMLAEGLTILAGKPKKGKSYLALDMSLSLAVGREAFMKFQTEKSRVLYVSLEDGERRLQRRLRQIQPNLATPQNLHFLYAFPRLGEGALEALQHYSQEFQVIIIDTLGRILPRETPARKSLSEYQEMTDMLGAIQGFAQDQRMAIVVIDHVRKASVEDDGDAIIGSQGKFGAADHALIYGRKGEEKDGVIKVISRDLDDQKIVISMVNGHLEFVGKGEIYEMDAEQNRILKVLDEEGRPLGIPDIMRAMGISGEAHYARFRKVMQRLYDADRVGKTKRGLYRLYGGGHEEERVPGVPF